MARGPPFSKILVALDGSGSSQAALDVAIDIAKRDDADLAAVCVSSTPTAIPLGPAGGGFDRMVSASKKEAEKVLDQAKEKAAKKGVNIKTQVLNDSYGIAATIVNYAESKKSDLIVTGTRGKTRLKKMLLGSVAQGVVTYAPCSVIVVR